MNKAFLKKLDASEFSRVKEKTDELRERESLQINSLFRSDIAAKTLEKGNQAFVNGFDQKILPNAVPFSDRVFLEICPFCECVRCPELLTPYLEKGLVVPILGAHYRYYAPRFIESILGYPYISSFEFDSARMLTFQRTTAKLMSKTEVTTLEKKCNSLIQSLPINKKQKLWESDKLEIIFINLQPYFYPDNKILQKLFKSLEEKSARSFNRLFLLSHVVYSFRNSQVFSFIPQVEIQQLDTLKLLNQREYGRAKFDISDIRDFIMTGLKLSYDPSIPLRLYLDIVSERKSKISKIVNNIIDRAKPEKKTFFANLQTELEHINQEVEALKSSKKRVAFDLVTNFALQNKTIVAGIIMGASMGIAGLGLVGCGAGIASGIVTKIVSKKAEISVPKEADALVKKLSTVLEPNYEKILAKALSSNINAIQIWQLRKKITR
jgi:hypothetical protein